MQEATRYPRASGVLVPVLLLRAGCPVMASAQTAHGRQRVAVKVIAWVNRSIRRLPAAVMEAELPEPREILTSWTVGPRTRGALEEMLARGESLPRRLADYVGAPRISASVLVDLLAARDEVGAVAPALSGGAAPLAWPKVDTFSELDLRGRAAEIATVIHGAMPCYPSKLGTALVAAGLVAVAPSFEEVTRAYRTHRLAAPFRIARRGGVSLLAARESITAIEVLITNAKRLVLRWGVCAVTAVLERLRAIKALSLDTKAATRVLMAIPRFRWVDEASGWFSLAGANSRLMSAVRKVFTIAERVRLIDLGRALVKQVQVLETFPAWAWERYLRDVLGCEISDGWVRARAVFGPASLSRAESAILRALHQHGGELAARSLREYTSRQGITARAVRDVLGTSPFLTVAGDRIRLVGESRGPANGNSEKPRTRSVGRVLAVLLRADAELLQPAPDRGAVLAELA